MCYGNIVQPYTQLCYIIAFFGFSFFFKFFGGHLVIGVGQYCYQYETYLHEFFSSQKCQTSIDEQNGLPWRGKNCSLSCFCWRLSWWLLWFWWEKNNQWTMKDSVLNFSFIISKNELKLEKMLLPIFGKNFRFYSFSFFSLKKIISQNHH